MQVVQDIIIYGHVDMWYTTLGHTDRSNVHACYLYVTAYHSVLCPQSRTICIPVNPESKEYNYHFMVMALTEPYNYIVA